MNSVQPYLPVILGLLPALFAWIGASVAGVLRQDGLPPVVNSLISILVVAACAVLDVFVAGKFTGNLSLDAATTQASFNVLLAGGLHTLTPYVSSLQSNVLALIKPPAPFIAPPVAPAKVTKAAYPTAQAWINTPGSSDHSG
jgi:hypothetical protein